MFSKSELLDAIEELEMSPATYQNAEKLATFYNLYDHLYVRKEPVSRIESINEVIVDDYGDSEFLQAVAGRKADQIWMVMDELMETVKVLQPKLYQAVIDKINGD
jgi:flagellar motor component MotA